MRGMPSFLYREIGTKKARPSGSGFICSTRMALLDETLVNEYFCKDTGYEQTGGNEQMCILQNALELSGG